MKKQPFASLRRHATWILVAWLLLGAAFGATVLLLRRPQTVAALCRFSASALGEALGLSVQYQQCSLDPLTATLAMGGISAVGGKEGERKIAIDSVELRLRPLQALAGGLQIERLAITGLNVDWRQSHEGTGKAASSGCWSRPLKLVHIESLQLDGANVAADVPGGRVSLHDVKVASLLSHGIYRIEASTHGEVAMRDQKPLDVKNLALTAELDVGHDRAKLRSVKVDVGSINVEVTGLIDGLCKPRPNLQTHFDAPIAELAELAGLKQKNPQGELIGTVDWDQTADMLGGQLALKGFAFAAYKAPPIQVKFSGSDRELKIDGLHIELDPESVADITGTIGLRGKMPVELDVQVKNGPLARVLDDADITHSWADFRANLAGHLQGHLAPPFLVTGSVGGDILNFTLDDEGWDEASKHKRRLLTVYPKVHIQSDLHIDREALRFEHAKLKSPLSEAQVDATLNYESRKGLKVVAQFPHLELSELKQIAGLDWGGAGIVSATIEGPYSTITIDGKVAFDDFRLLDVDFGAVTGPLVVDVSTAMLRFPDLACQKGRTTYRAGGSLDLDHEATLDVHFDVDRNGRIPDLLDALMALQPAVAELRKDVGGEFFGTAEIHGPARHIAGSANLELPHLTLFDRVFRRGTLTGRIRDGHDFLVDNFDVLEGEGGLRAEGTVTIDGEVAMNLDAKDLSVEKLLWMEGDPSARGLLSVKGHIGGQLDAPSPSGEIAIDNFSVFNVPLGRSKSHLKTEGRIMHLAGQGGNEVTFEGTGELVGRGPYKAHFEGATKHLEHYLSSRFEEPVSGEVAGVLALQGDLLDPERSKGAFDISHLVVVDHRLRLESLKPVHLGLDAGTLDLSATELSAGSGRVILGGTLSHDNVLDTTIKGDLEAKMLEGLVPRIERLSGRAFVQASVRGPSDAPAVVGSLSLERGGFTWSGLPLVFSNVDGVAEFSHRKVLLTGAHGDLNGGTADVSGEVLLRGFTFGRYDLAMALKNVALRIPESIPSQVSGSLTLKGDPERDLKMTGVLDVPTARYAKNFDVDTIVESFRSREASEGTASSESTGEPMRYDILLRGGNDLRVDSDLAHLKLEGDLRLTGTVESPGLLGTMTARNGFVDFRGYRYHVDRAAITFTDADEIAPEFDVTADTDARQYRVFAHLFGTLKSYRLQLSSQPALTQEDIAKLLTIGVTSQDAVATTSAGSAGFGADVLWNISGLNDEVRRLLPHNQLIRDLSVSPSSAFIEATGQVEPVVRVETRVLTDRLKLSAQIPVTERAGTRVSAEYLLDEHLSLQGEWNTDYTDYSFGDIGANLRARFEFGE